MIQNYQIKLEIFEGPMDLLLYLVTKNEVDIRDIKVGQVCVQFLEYIQLMKDLNIDIAGDYLVMAATLTRLKARELLPQEEQSELLIDEDDICREQLIQQLLEYKKFKEAAQSLKTMEEKQIGTFYKTLPEKVEWTEEFEEQGIDATVFDLMEAFKRILQQVDRVPTHDIIREDVKLDDRIEHVISYMMDHDRAKFEDLFMGVKSRMMLVVTFMAILELMKMEQIRIRQESQFGQIWIEKRNDPETNSPERIDGEENGRE